MYWQPVKQFFGGPRDSVWNRLKRHGGATDRRALIVGINHYQNVPQLSGCIPDAREMQRVLSCHDRLNRDGGLENFYCELLVSDKKGPLISTKLLKKKWLDLFEDHQSPNKKFQGDVLFYFSGHGAVNEFGGHLVTQDADPDNDDFGVEMESLLLLANRHSDARSTTIIIDACHSGTIGNPPDDGGLAKIKSGISILSASMPNEDAKEFDDGDGYRGVFTKLVIGALEGGGADVLGNVSPASIFAYAEAALGPQDQSPMYKTHASDWETVRRCRSQVSTDDLRDIKKYFPAPNHNYPLDPEYEESELQNFDNKKESRIVVDAKKSSNTAIDVLSDEQRARIKNKIKIFKLFKRYQVVGLLEPEKEKLKIIRPENENDLYWAAVENMAVRLTPLGQYYQRLSASGKITDD